MSLYNEIKDSLDFKKRKHVNPFTNERERRLLFIAIAGLLFILAIGALVLTTVASSSGVGACKSIILVDNRDSCFYNLANRTSNYSICSYLPQRADSYQCIAAVAEKVGDVKICDRINSSDFQYENCIYNVSYEKGNESDCLVLNNQSESTCVFNVAKRNQFSNKSDCDPIINGSQKSLCYSIYYYNDAVVQNVPSDCALLPNEVNATVLVTLVTRDFENNQTGNLTSYLSYSELNVTPISYCYYNVATAHNDRADCAYATGLISNSCYGYFSTNTTSNTTITNTTQLCSDAPSYAQNICLYSVYTDQAVADENASACSQIKNSSYQQSCVVQVAEKYGNSGYCDYIENNVTAQQACIVAAESG